MFDQIVWILEALSNFNIYGTLISKITPKNVVFGSSTSLTHLNSNNYKIYELNWMRELMKMWRKTCCCGIFCKIVVDCPLKHPWNGVWIGWPFILFSEFRTFLDYYLFSNTKKIKDLKGRFFCRRNDFQ